MRNISGLMLGFGCVLSCVALVASGCSSDDETTTTAASGASSSAAGTGGSGGSGGGSGGDTSASSSAATGTGGSEDPTNDCETYCDLVSDNCTGDNAQYTSADNCEAVCEAFDAGEKGTDATATGENTRGCRIYHGNLPASMDPGVHCSHAGPGGDGQCGDNCESFCTIQMELCTGANEQYEDLTTCITACAAFTTDGADKYDAGDTTDDSNGFNCRLYHLAAAADDPAVHCPHTKTGAADPDPCGAAPSD